MKCAPVCVADMSCLQCGAGSLSTLGVSRFAKKYPAVLTALLKSLLELICKYERAVAG